MAQRRAITSHPAFGPLIALWLAALLGLIIAVLPTQILEHLLRLAGLGSLVPLTIPNRMGLGLATAIFGALCGFGLARWLARRSNNPRPVYADEVQSEFSEAPSEEPARRPLRVREELADSFDEEAQLLPESLAGANPVSSDRQPEDGLMILTPQPIHPPRSDSDLEALVEQFDSAFATFRASESSRPPASSHSTNDTVQSFVAQQTGGAVSLSTPSPLGGLVPDHQAELRAALDKLARSQH